MATAEKAATKTGPVDIKVEQPKNDSTKAKPPDQNANKQAKIEKKPSAKKEPNKLNPVKARGKNSEAEKKSLKQVKEEQSGRNNKFGGKNAKKEKKEPEKELYLRFGKKVLNAKEEEVDLDDNFDDFDDIEDI